MDSSEPSWRYRALRDAVLAGDTAAWKVLYDENFESLYSYAYRQAGRRHEIAEEVVQETWVIVVRKIRAFDPDRGSFGGWLKGIADNVLRSHLRRAARAGKIVTWEDMDQLEDRSPQLAERPDLVAAGPSEPEAPQLGEEVALTLAVLPSRYQAVLRAKYQENLAVSDIALRWGATPKAVESLLSRAREAFREAYGRLRKGASQDRSRCLSPDGEGA